MNKLYNVLEARELRWQRRVSLAARGFCSLSLTLRMPADRRTEEKILPFFERSCARVSRRITQRFGGFSAFETMRSADGPYALWQIAADAEMLKLFCIGLEETLPAGMLLDLDVMDAGGAQPSRGDYGFGPRLCLVCGGSAALCVRARKHSTEEISHRIDALLKEESEDAE